MQIRINEPAESKLKELAAVNKRTPTAEGQMAVDRHLEQCASLLPAAKPRTRKRK